MNKLAFSPSTAGFYVKKNQPAYEENGLWPADVIDVDDTVAIKFQGEPPAGKIRIADNDGMPAWGDIQSPTENELAIQAETTRANLRAIADSEIAWRQDAVDAGIATEEETAALAEWKKYRVLLMRVDTAKPVWPTPPAETAS